MPGKIVWLQDPNYDGVAFGCGAHIRGLCREWIEAATTSQIFDECERLLQDIRYTIATYEY